MEECPRKFKEIECYKCGLSHMVGDHSCEFHKHAVDIEGKKRRGEISYEESKKRYNSLNRKSLDDLWYSTGHCLRISKHNYSAWIFNPAVFLAEYFIRIP